jgi:hypothetical protein
MLDAIATLLYNGHMNNTEYTPKQHRNRRIVKSTIQEQPINEIKPVEQSNTSKKMVIFPSPFSDREQEERERIRKIREKPIENEQKEQEPQKKRIIDLSDTSNLLSDQSIHAAKKTIEQSIGIPNKNNVITQKPENMSGDGKLIIVLIAAAGIAAAVMSVYHGYNYLISVGYPVWIAMVTAVIMVFFSCIIFSLQYKGFFGYILRLLGIATISFSIFSTIAVNYGRFSKVEAIEKSAVHFNESKKMELEILQIKLEGINNQIENAERESEYWKKISWDRRDLANKELQEAYALKNQTLQEINLVISTAPLSEKESIFVYIAGIFNVKNSTIEFILFCIPAIFYDLLSTFAINTVLILKRKKNK